MSIQLFFGIRYIIVQRENLERNFSESYREWGEICRTDMIDFDHFLMSVDRGGLIREIIFDDFLIAFPAPSADPFGDLYDEFCQYGLNLWNFQEDGGLEVDWVDGCIVDIDENGRVSVRGRECEWLCISPESAVLCHVNDEKRNLIKLIDCAFLNNVQEIDFYEKLKNLIEGKKGFCSEFTKYNGVWGKIWRSEIGELTFYSRDKRSLYRLMVPIYKKNFELRGSMRYFYPTFFDMIDEIILWSNQKIYINKYLPLSDIPEISIVPAHKDIDDAKRLFGKSALRDSPAGRSLIQGSDVDRSEPWPDFED